MGVQVRGAEGDGGEDGAGGGRRAAGAVGPGGVRPEREAGPGGNHGGGLCVLRPSLHVPPLIAARRCCSQLQAKATDHFDLIAWNQAAPECDI